MKSAQRTCSYSHKKGLTYLINVRTLDLRLSDKMVSQEVSVVPSSALNLVQTLVGVEAKLLALLIQLLRLFT
jgi:hypothetical protein